MDGSSSMGIESIKCNHSTGEWIRSDGKTLPSNNIIHCKKESVEQTTIDDGSSAQKHRRTRSPDWMVISLATGGGLIVLSKVERHHSINRFTLEFSVWLHYGLYVFVGRRRRLFLLLLSLLHQLLPVNLRLKRPLQPVYNLNHRLVQWVKKTSHSFLSFPFLIGYRKMKTRNDHSFLIHSWCFCFSRMVVQLRLLLPLFLLLLPLNLPLLLLSRRSSLLWKEKKMKRRRKRRQYKWRVSISREEYRWGMTKWKSEWDD